MLDLSWHPIPRHNQIIFKKRPYECLARSDWLRKGLAYLASAEMLPRWLVKLDFA